MRVRQKELRRTRKRLEERRRLAAKGIAVTGGASATARPNRAATTSRRSSETAPAPRPQGGRRDGGQGRGGDRGPRRDGNQGGGERRERPQAQAAPAENAAPTEG